MERTFTPEEAGHILHMSDRTVRKWCKRLGVRKHGPAYFITLETIDELAKVDSTPGRKVADV